MARLTKPLTDTEIKNARPKEADYTLHDGDGLQLLIKTSGKKSGNIVIFGLLTKNEQN